ncbi:MAG: hypothetical protein RL697_1032 [Pseudomonadota bacterium]
MWASGLQVQTAPGFKVQGAALVLAASQAAAAQGMGLLPACRQFDKGRCIAEIESAQHALALVFAFEHQHLRVAGPDGHAAVDQRGLLFAPGQQLGEVAQQAARLARLLIHCQGAVGSIQRQPGA